MILLLKFTFFLSLSLVFYVYLGYPLLLWAANVLRRKRGISRGEITPPVTLIISAYNEEKVICEKIENSLALDYPRDRLQVLVVSDASTDATDRIVSGFSDRGVILHRLEERRCKTWGLNEAVARARGEILVFSDANAFYHSDALRKLVRNFADPTVGYAVGESKYVHLEGAPVGKGEALYWRYEDWLKRMESALCSIVGADGAIYAIRKGLYRPMQPADISDFVNPLQIIVQGYRGIYEPEAICDEETAANYPGEFRRKVRIVGRSLRGLGRVKEVLNPFRYGLFALEVISHKLIRWFVPFLLAGVFLSNLGLALLDGRPFYRLALLLQVAFYSLAFVGRLFSRLERQYRIFSLPYYFCLVNYASLKGVMDGLRGRVQAVWEPH